MIYSVDEDVMFVTLLTSDITCVCTLCGPCAGRSIIVMLAQKSVLLLQTVPSWNQPQARGMATLKMISLRLKSVKNIQKITQSMKMVSAAKYARAERELRGARPFGHGAQAFYEKAEVAPPEDAKTKLIVAMTSDRGLCGAIHSSVARLIRVK
jgi:F-type H+-transporting ATPase subunit gamma